MSSFIGYIILFPLVGFLLNGLFGKKMKSERISGIIGSGAVGLSFLISVMIFFELLQAPADHRFYNVKMFQWISAGSFTVNIAYQIDQLSILMALIVTGVGFLIHVYSIGYMHGDPAFWRFFAYLNLFLFMMLNLILANNFLLMFLGWEGVGLCSYLLIGFWHDRKFDTGGYIKGEATTSDAAKKAFIVNRIGDFGFLVAMFLIFTTFGSLSFDDVFSRASATVTSGDKTICWITLLLFLGATGKSAQIPLYVWLPDAMAGPTPVSALIHAATMVTAGVYMVARCSILYALAPITLQIVAGIGIITALFAATIGLVQNDIKKILAYSTISQLGYMFLGLGVGSFASGIFHVMTHAFFKALLFLGAGAVIHAMHEEQDIRLMGGLRSHMPVTSRTFLLAALAIAGIPPLSGFFSKDEILWQTFVHGSLLLWVLGWLTAGITAFYMFRLFSLTFEGEGRYSHEIHPHEASKSMTIPLVILAVLTVIGGVVGVPESLGGGNAIEHWLEPVFQHANSKLMLNQEKASSAEFILMALSVGIAVFGIYTARTIYLKRISIVTSLTRSFHTIYNWALNKYYIDELYDRVIVTPLRKGSERLLWNVLDVVIIDGCVNGVASLVARLSSSTRKIQNGIVQGYALAFVVGVILILGILILR